MRPSEWQSFSRRNTFLAIQPIWDVASDRDAPLRYSTPCYTNARQLLIHFPFSAYSIHFGRWWCVTVWLFCYWNKFVHKKKREEKIIANFRVGFFIIIFIISAVITISSNHIRPRPKSSVLLLCTVRPWPRIWWNESRKKYSKANVANPFGCVEWQHRNRMMGTARRLRTAEMKKGESTQKWCNKNDIRQNVIILLNHFTIDWTYDNNLVCAEARVSVKLWMEQMDGCLAAVNTLKIETLPFCFGHLFQFPGSKKNPQSKPTTKRHKFCISRSICVCLCIWCVFASLRPFANRKKNRVFFYYQSEVII